MDYRMFRQKLLLVLLLITSILILDARAYQNEKYDLELTIHCRQTDIKQGDEIPIIFTITNKDESVYSIEDRNYDRSGRLYEYKLVTTKEDGSTVRDPRKNWPEGLGGGLVAGQVELSKGDSYSKTIALNKWSLIKEPGRYSVTGTYFYYVIDPDAEQKRNTIMTKEVLVHSAPIEIVVKSRSDWQMKTHIKKLVKELNETKLSRRTREQRQAIVSKLAYTCDESIVPTLTKLMYSENEQFQAIEAICCYIPHTPEIKNVVLKTMKKRDLTDGMGLVMEQLGFTEEEIIELILMSLKSENPDGVSVGALIAQNHPHDSFIPMLVTIGNDPNNNLAQWRAYYALWHNRSEQGIKAFKTLPVPKH
jgi:hypothetical protein